MATTTTCETCPATVDTDATVCLDCLEDWAMSDLDFASFLESIAD